MFKSYKDFPVNSIKKRAWHIYPRKGIIQVDGIKKFKLKDLKNIPLDTRLSFPHGLFVAINKA